MWLFAFFGLFSTAVIVTILLFVSSLDLNEFFPDRDDEPLPKNIVLELNLSRGLAEGAEASPFAAFSSFGPKLSMFEMVQAIDRAANDPRVSGMIADLSGAEFGFAQTQELRQAVSRFRGHGKFAYAYADSFEGGGSVGPYYLATAFERISIQPSGILAFMGITLEYPMLGDALRDLGISPEFYQRHEYKGAMASVSEAEMPGPIKRNLEQLVQNLFNQVSTSVADSRRLSPSTIASLMDEAPLLAKEARNNGFIDHLQYRDQAIESALSEGGSKAGLVAIDRYAHDDLDREDNNVQRLALVTAVGPIVRGSGRKFRPSDPISSGYLADVIKSVREDEDVSGMILRINSPGGSYVASDTILREIARFRDTGRPVVVSMGDVAASGGYFLALEADHIIAQPGTLTGSIGVIAGKFAISDLLQQYKIGTEKISIGQNAGMFSPLNSFTPSQRRRLNVILDEIYNDFTGRVADARQLNEAELDAAARGRVWTGEDARRAGLIDGLGGYSEAIRLMRQSINIGPGDRLEVKRFPREREPFEKLLEMIEDGGFAQLWSQLAAIGGIVEKLEQLEKHIGVTQIRGDGVINSRSPSLEVR